MKPVNEEEDEREDNIGGNTFLAYTPTKINESLKGRSRKGKRESKKEDKGENNPIFLLIRLLIFLFFSFSKTWKYFLIRRSGSSHTIAFHRLYLSSHTFYTSSFGFPLNLLIQTGIC